MKLRVDFFLALYEKRNSSDVDYSTERISPSSRTRFMKQHAALISSTETVRELQSFYKARRMYC